MAFARRETLLSRLRSNHRWPRSPRRRRHARHRTVAFDLSDSQLPFHSDGLGDPHRRSARADVDLAGGSRCTAKAVTPRAWKIYDALAEDRDPIPAGGLNSRATRASSQVPRF